MDKRFNSQIVEMQENENEDWYIYIKVYDI